jgi:hypothetical protein
MIPDLPPQLVAALSDAPLALMLLWVMIVLRRDLAARDQPPAPPPAPAAHDGREELAAFKLEVARTYVPLSLIRDLDTRLTQQLGRLEEKLDEVSRAATAAAAVSGHALPPRRIGYGIHASEGES